LQRSARLIAGYSPTFSRQIHLPNTPISFTSSTLPQNIHHVTKIQEMECQLSFVSAVNGNKHYHRKLSPEFRSRYGYLPTSYSYLEALISQPVDEKIKITYNMDLIRFEYQIKYVRFCKDVANKSETMKVPRVVDRNEIDAAWLQVNFNKFEEMMANPQNIQR
jgi:hypothetical protein